MTSAGRAKELAELSGMALGTAPLSVGRVVVPVGLGVDGPDLAYDLLADEHGNQPHESSADGLLDAFRTIRTPDDVLRFATKFGTLELCELHGLPSGPTSTGMTIRSPHAGGCPLRDWPRPREPLSKWLALAAQANSIIELAGHLHGGGIVKPEARIAAWHRLYEGRGQKPADLDKLAQVLAKDRRLAITFLSEYVNYWLALGGARPALIWPGFSGAEATASLELRATGTFGLIAIQLATAVAKAQDIYICDGCKNSYLRTERPPRSGRNYCLTCKGQGIDERDRKRRQRRLAGKRRPHGKTSTR